MIILLVLAIILYLAIGVAARTTYRWHKKKRRGFNPGPLKLNMLLNPDHYRTYDDDGIVIIAYPLVMLACLIYLMAIEMPKRIFKKIWDLLGADRKDRIRGFLNKLGEKELLK